MLLVSTIFIGFGIVEACAQYRPPKNLSDLDVKILVETLPRDLPADPSAQDLPGLLQLIEWFEGRSNWIKDEKAPGFEATSQLINSRARRAFEATDLDTLRTLALGPQENGESAQQFIPLLSRRMIEQEIRRIVSEPKPKFSFPAGPQQELGNAPFADAKARQEIFKAARPFNALIEEVAKGPRRDSRTDRGAFYSLFEAVLTGKGSNIAQQLLAFDKASSWCGSDTGEWEANRFSAVFLDLLKQRRLSEAVGASFGVPPPPKLLRTPNRPFDPWRVDLLNYCGISWEDATLGESYSLEFLASHGSVRAARALVDYPANRDQSRVESGIEAFIVPGGPDGGVSASDVNDPRTRIPIELQRDLLNRLTNGIEPRSDLSRIRRALGALGRLHRAETKDTLFALLRHPSAEIVREATNILRSMGEDVKPAAPSSSIRPPK